MHLDSLEIRPLDLDRAEEASAFAASFRQAHRHENPDRPAWSERELVAHLREPVGEEVVALAAFAGEPTGELVGGAIASYPMLDNVTMAFVEVFVPPAQRNRGVGSALAEHVVAAVREAGRKVVLTEAWYAFDRRDDHAYRRFAEKHGFALASTEVARRLELPVDDALIGAWIDECAPSHRDYLIKTFVDGDVPDELIPSLCHVINQLAADAPSGDIEFEAEQMTPDVWRQRRGRNRKQGMLTYETVAVGEDGDVVAATVIGVPTDDDTRAHQWATIVLDKHRGHRLGLAIKARNLRALQHHQPERLSLHTCNAEVNAAMIAINERMGFKPIELLGAFQRKLDG